MGCCVLFLLPADTLQPRVRQASTESHADCVCGSNVQLHQPPVHIIYNDTTNALQVPCVQAELCWAMLTGTRDQDARRQRWRAAKLHHTAGPV